MPTLEGTFDVTLTPAPDAPLPDGLAAQTIDKTFTGGLVGTSRGLMLSCFGQTPGSAGYVAQEVVDGTVDGRRGRFALQHLGAMTPNGGSVQIEVVPGSGADELAGLTGTMDLVVEDGVHLYTFTYALDVD